MCLNSLRHISNRIGHIKSITIMELKKINLPGFNTSETLQILGTEETIPV